MAACSDTNFGNKKGTSKHMILVPLFGLKVLDEIAAGGAGTSNRRHWRRVYKPGAAWRHRDGPVEAALDVVGSGCARLARVRRFPGARTDLPELSSVDAHDQPDRAARSRHAHPTGESVEHSDGWR